MCPVLQRAQWCLKATGLASKSSVQVLSTLFRLIRGQSRSVRVETQQLRHYAPGIMHRKRSSNNAPYSSAGCGSSYGCLASTSQADVFLCLQATVRMQNLTYLTVCISQTGYMRCQFWGAPVSSSLRHSIRNSSPTPIPSWPCFSFSLSLHPFPLSSLHA